MAGRGKEVFTDCIVWQNAEATAENFHAAADDQGATLVILSIEQGSGIVGGYTRRPWRSSGGEAPEPTRSTFVFALRNRGLA